MKKLLNLFIITVVLGFSFMSCQTQEKPEPTCHIYGTMESDEWNGKRIFLVPMFGPQDAEHVDSVVIENGKFEFTPDTMEMKVIKLDYHFRAGTQELLVVSEPGDIHVLIGKNSTSAGTPQNDSLQVWKDGLAKYNKKYNELRAKAMETKDESILLTEGKVIQQELKAFNLQMKENMKEGIFYEFLQKMYPSDK